MNKNFWLSTDALHPDLLATKNHVWDQSEFNYSQPLMEAESAEYGAYTLKLNNRPIIFRVAKITPTKIGQFVTLWKRIGKGPIQPYDISDSVDFFIISVRKNNHFGQFIFPKHVLCEQDVVSKNNEGGKRAIRVYPPWDKTTSRQAQKTQQWQLEYFLEIPQNQEIDRLRTQMLYRLLKSSLENEVPGLI